MNSAEPLETPEMGQCPGDSVYLSGIFHVLSSPLLPNLSDSGSKAGSVLLCGAPRGAKQSGCEKNHTLHIMLVKTETKPAIKLLLSLPFLWKTSRL